jgi:hypothetical protein
MSDPGKEVAGMKTKSAILRLLVPAAIALVAAATPLAALAANGGPVGP